MRDFVRECVEQMKGYVPGEQPDDPAIIKLNTNENPYPPSPRALAAYRSFDPAELRLYSEPMSLALRKALAARLEGGVDQIFIGNGSDEVLALCTRAFVENDGSIGYFDPSYSLYPVLSDIRGVEQRPVPLTDDFRWQMPDDYAASLFLLTNPNAPTGMAHPQKLIEGFCRDFDGVVVVDEAYGDFAAEDALALARSRDNVLVARTLSKSFSLAGLRVGFAVGAPALIAALYKIKDSYNMDMVAQRVALAAVEDWSYMEQTKARILATRERLTGVLQGLGFDVSPSATNFLWVQHGRLAGARVFEALRDQQILVRRFDQGGLANFLRISMGTDAQIDRLIEVLTELCAP